MTATRRIHVDDLSQVAEGRRVAAGLASSFGLCETEIGKVSIVVTELATNLIKHARGGELVLSSAQSDGVWLEILALDKGDGMRNVRQCMEDGYSTAGSPGGGLGAVARLSSHLEIYSAPHLGTAALTMFGAAHAADPAAMAVGGLSVAMQGEDVCGDAWAALPTETGMSILVADGLGHGPGAAEAAERAVEIFYRNPALTPKDMIATIHAGLRNTRGAAVGVARLDMRRNEVVFAGLGNISGLIVSEQGSQRSMVSQNGIAGVPQVATTIQEFNYPFPEGALAILHSDGLVTHWKLAAYPGLARRHPSLVSAVLYRDFARGRDDVTVVTARRAAS